MSTNIKSNQVNEVIGNELKFDISNSLANNPVKNPLPIVTVRLIGSKKSRHTLKSGIICFWDSEATGSMINSKHINPYKFKLRANKFNYITVSVPYTTTHDVKVPFSIPEFYSSKIITHQFHIDNT